MSERNQRDDEQDDRHDDAERRRQVENDAKFFVPEVDENDIDEKPDEGREANDEEDVRHEDANHPAPV